jgi:hypothetical protein
MISKNRTQDWQTADTYAALGLTWLVTPNGSDESYLLTPIGVTHLAAAGLIPLDSTVLDKQTGEKRHLQDVLRTGSAAGKEPAR